MGLRVNTNIISLTAQKNLSMVTKRLEGNFARLASGMRIASAADDPAGLGISERMRSQLKSLSQASRNGQDGISLVQTAEGALSEAGTSLARMRELAIASANGTLTDDDRVTLDAEFQALISEIARISETTTFNGVGLLNNASASATIPIQIGTEEGEVIELPLLDTTQTSLGLGSGITLSSIATSTSALSIIDAAIDSVSRARGNFGAVQNRLQSAVRSLASAQTNLAAAESRIRDVDVAFETADLTRNSILQQASVSVLAQANQQPQIALSLLQG